MVRKDVQRKREAVGGEMSSASAFSYRNRIEVLILSRWAAVVRQNKGGGH